LKFPNKFQETSEGEINYETTSTEHIDISAFCAVTETLCERTRPTKEQRSFYKHISSKFTQPVSTSSSTAY